MECKVLDQKSYVPQGGEDHATKGGGGVTLFQFQQNFLENVHFRLCKYFSCSKIYFKMFLDDLLIKIKAINMFSVTKVLQRKMDSSFVDHEEEVTESVQYICDTCGNSYSSKSNLRRHAKSHSETNEQRCGKTFTSSYNLARHRKTHEPHITNLLCPHCGENYN